MNTSKIHLQTETRETANLSENTLISETSGGISGVIDEVSVCSARVAGFEVDFKVVCVVLCDVCMQYFCLFPQTRQPPAPTASNINTAIKRYRERERDG